MTMDDFVIKKISRGMLIVSLNGHEISFEGEMSFTLPYMRKQQNLLRPTKF